MSKGIADEKRPMAKLLAEKQADAEIFRLLMWRRDDAIRYDLKRKTPFSSEIWNALCIEI